MVAGVRGIGGLEGTDGWAGFFEVCGMCCGTGGGGGLSGTWCVWTGGVTDVDWATVTGIGIGMVRFEGAGGGLVCVELVKAGKSIKRVICATPMLKRWIS